MTSAKVCSTLRTRVMQWKAAKKRVGKVEKRRVPWDVDSEDEGWQDAGGKKRRKTTVQDCKPNQDETKDDVDPLDQYMMEEVIPEVERIKKEDEKKAARAKDDRKNDNEEEEEEALAVIADEDEDDGNEPGSSDDEEWARQVQAGKSSKIEKLMNVDHDQIDYPAFRKEFYREVPELKRESEETVEFMRQELDNIRVRGKNVCRPVKTWAQCGLSTKVMDIIKEQKYEKPMPIQAQALPVIMSGRDCIGIAKTGSGKTLAFVLPMLRHVRDQPALANGDGPIGLIMAPTRELVQQIGKEIKTFAKHLGLSCVCVFGGSGVANQISDLRRGAEVVVCTPGRMIDILATSRKITNLRRITYLVLDEADRMFDMGFEPQIMKIIRNIRPDRQTVMFSATFPRQVEVLARNILTDPVEIMVGGRSVVNADIEQRVEVRPAQERYLRLLELLGEWYELGKILVFVHTQDGCDSLFKDLLKAGYPCMSLHGGKEQTDRESTISDFKGDVCNIMVATSVAARGLDVKDLKLVVNYDVPNHHEDYVHRVGRTGRAGNKGMAVTFIAPDEEQYAPDLVKALKESHQSIPEDLQALADTFWQKKKAGTVEGHGSGFGGSGYKFDDEEDEKTRAARKAQARGYDEFEGSDNDSQDDNTIRAVGVQAHPPESAGIAREASAEEEDGTGTAAKKASTTQTTMQKVPPPSHETKPSRAESESKKHLPPSTADAVRRAAAVAAAAVAQRQAALHTPAASAVTAKPTMDGKMKGFEVELEINDFPQHARWKVTHKESIRQICDFTGAAITTRGKFYPPGKNPPPGANFHNKKLHLLIEGKTEQAVREAKAELKKILERSTATAYDRGLVQGPKYYLT